jgi:CRP-like cAMP-binding protein
MSAAAASAAASPARSEPAGLAAASPAPEAAVDANVDIADLERDLNHEEHKQARRNSVNLALQSFEEGGHDTSMERRKSLSVDNGVEVPAAAAAMIAARKSMKSTMKKQREEAWLGAVHRCTLLSGLHPPELAYVLKAARPRDIKEGETVYSQGDPITGGFMFVIASGRLRALVQRLPTAVPHRARDFGPQDSFGSPELLCHDGAGVRTCTIVALTDSVVWGIPQRVVDTKLRIPPPLKISGLLAFCEGLKVFEGLSHERLQQVCRGAEQRKLAPAAVVFEKGDRANHIYAVREGSVHTAAVPGSDFFLSIVPPATFGESALSADDELRVRGASIVAGDAGATLVVWHIASIETLLGFELQEASLGLQNRTMLEDARFGSHSLAQGLSKDEMDELFDMMDERSYAAKESIVRDGAIDEALLLIKSGEAHVQRSGEGSSGAETLAVLRRGDCVGEAMLCVEAEGALRTTKRKTRVLAKTDLVALVLTPAALAKLVSNEAWQAWREGLSEHLAATAHAGIDCVTVDRLTAAGSEAVIASLDAKAKAGLQTKGKKVAPKSASASTPKTAAKPESKGEKAPKAGASPASSKLAVSNAPTASSPPTPKSASAPKLATPKASPSGPATPKKAGSSPGAKSAGGVAKARVSKTQAVPVALS